MGGISREMLVASTQPSPSPSPLSSLCLRATGLDGRWVSSENELGRRMTTQFRDFGGRPSTEWGNCGAPIPSHVIWAGPPRMMLGRKSVSTTWGNSGVPNSHSESESLAAAPRGVIVHVLRNEMGSWGLSAVWAHLEIFSTSRCAHTDWILYANTTFTVSR